MTPLSLTIPGFREKFPDNESCKDFLMKQRWQLHACCIKCNSKDLRKGSTAYHRRCLACGYEESILKNTVFEGIKFPLQKAFYMAYRLRDKNGNISSIKMMLETALSVPSVIRFKKRLTDTLLRNSNPIKPAQLTVENFLEGLI